MKNLNWKSIFIVFSQIVSYVMSLTDLIIVFVSSKILISSNPWEMLFFLFSCCFLCLLVFSSTVISQAIVIPASIHQPPQNLGTRQLSRAAIFMILPIFKHLIQDSCRAEATFPLRHRILVPDLDLMAKLTCSVLFEGYLDLWCTSIHSISSKKLYFLFDYLFVCFL